MKEKSTKLNIPYLKKSTKIWREIFELKYITHCTRKGANIAFKRHKNEDNIVNNNRDELALLKCKSEAKMIKAQSDILGYILLFHIIIN